jgi:hypothetical protein
MAWSYQTKNSGSWNNLDRSDATTYFISESGDYYLVGENEDKFLVSQESGSNWNHQIKNSGNWSYQIKY